MMFMGNNQKKKEQGSGSIFSIITQPFSDKKSQHSTKQIQYFFIQLSNVLKDWTSRLVSNDNTISYQRENYAQDKKDKVQQLYRSVKNSLQNTLASTVYTPLTFYEFHMIDHLHKLFNTVSPSGISQHIAYNPHVPNFLNVLSFTREVVSSETVEKSLRNYVVARLDALTKQVRQTQFATPDRKKQSLYSDVQTNIFFMILTFKFLQKQYSPYVRRAIKRIFNQLSSDDFMKTTETLRYLENQRPEIQLLPQLSQQELSSINDRLLMQTYDKLGKKGSIPKIHLKKISQQERRKIVNILISGFLSQDQDKKSQWKSLLNCMPDSEVYGLDWQSQTIGELVGFMASSVGDLVFTKKTLEDKFLDNPFNPAFGVAQQSGRYLAHLVDYLFPNQFINIIGYSLGTELIRDFVSTTIEINRGRNLQKIALLGGVSDANEYAKILERSNFPLSITNMFTANDSVLQILLKRCRKGIEPVGLKQLLKSEMHSIDNTDVSDYIGGHLAYMTNFGKIADMLELSEQ